MNMRFIAISLVKYNCKTNCSIAIDYAQFIQNKTKQNKTKSAKYFTAIIELNIKLCAHNHNSYIIFILVVCIYESF